MTAAECQNTSIMRVGREGQHECEAVRQFTLDAGKLTGSVARCVVLATGSKFSSWRERVRQNGAIRYAPLQEARAGDQQRLPAQAGR
jgi:hypothetical protein